MTVAKLIEKLNFIESGMTALGNNDSNEQNLSMTKKKSLENWLILLLQRFKRKKLSVQMSI